MKYKHLIVQNHKIAVYESNPDGDPVLFVHGNSLSAESFKYQLESEPGKKYRLIAFDLPGHGKSDKANDPKKIYSIEGFIGFMLELVDILKIGNAVFVGHSMGGHMIIDAMERFPNASGFVIFGAPPVQKPEHPMERSHFPNPAFMLAFTGKLDPEQLETLSAAYVAEKAVVPELIKTSLQQVDPLMRGTFGANAGVTTFPDEADIIRNMKRPLAVFHGEGDQMIRGTYFDELAIPTLWRNKLQMIKNSGHCPQTENPEEFNHLPGEFLRDIFN
jgi:pimeloyl-ACP methyl ester carboxylesterase